MDVPKINCYGYYIRVTEFDEEYRKIIRKLKSYGISVTGNKSVDKTRLHIKELQEAEKENIPTPKFLTVSMQEQEKIHAKKKNHKKEINLNFENNPTIGQEILGEQIMVSINIKQKKLKKAD